MTPVGVNVPAVGRCEVFMREERMEEMSEVSMPNKDSEIKGEVRERFV